MFALDLRFRENTITPNDAEEEAAQAAAMELAVHEDEQRLGVPFVEESSDTGQLSFYRARQARCSETV